MKVFRNITKFLFPPRKEELYYPLKKILTFSPHNIELYKQALLHRSFTEYDEAGHRINNERLEFLGDAIIEAVVSNYLFSQYGNEQEGFLTTMRSKLVRRSTLGRLSKDIGLNKLIKKGSLKGNHNSYIEGNAFEALVGAAYLDRGYRCCQKFFLSLLQRGYLVLENIERNEQNHKSVLLEWCQKYRINIEFDSIELDLPTNSRKPPFITHVIMEGHNMGEGRGYSKKESHQQAAKFVLHRILDRPRVAQHIIEDHTMGLVITDIFNTLNLNNEK